MRIQRLTTPTRTYGELIPVAPDTNAEVAKINELVDAVNAGLGVSNAIVGGPKYVRYTSSQYFNVPADALTLDRLDASTILPGNLAVVINPAASPLTDTEASQQYVATLVPASTAGAVQVPAYSGAPAGTTVAIQWQAVTTADTFTKLLTSELPAGKEKYAGLDLRPLLIEIIRGLGSANTVVTTPAPTAQPAAPTSGLVDDTADTFSFLPNPTYPSFAQYKVNGLPGVTGAVVLDAKNSYVQGSRIYVKVVGAVAKGGLAVYVAGSGSIPDGMVLTNADAFTGSAVIVAQPAAPTFSGFDDVANTVSVSHATLAVSELVYDFNGTTGIAVPLNNVISVGNLAGQVTAYAKATANRPEGLRANSQPFTVTAAIADPTVVLASPQEGKTLTVGDPVVLNATPDAKNSQVQKVEFLDNGVKFTETTVAPHTVQRNITAGAHSFTARVFNMVGKFGLSNPVQVSGIAPPTGKPVIDVVYWRGQSNIRGGGYTSDLKIAPLVDITPSLLRTFPRGYIVNADKSPTTLENYQVETNAQGFSQAIEGAPPGFCAILGVMQRHTELFPNRHLVCIKAAKANQGIENFRADANGGTNNLFGTMRDTVWQPGMALVQQLATQLGADINVIGEVWGQGETQPANTYGNYIANLEQIFSDARPYQLSGPNFRYFVEDTVLNNALNKIKRDWAATRTDVVPVDALRITHNEDDIHHKGKSQYLRGYYDLPAAFGWTPAQVPYVLDVAAEAAGQGTSTIYDQSGWLNHLTAKPGEEPILVQHPTSGYKAFGVSPDHIAKLTVQALGGISRMEYTSKTLHFVVQQSATTGLEFLFNNLGRYDLAPGNAGGAVTTSAGVIASIDASQLCIISIVATRLATTDADGLGQVTVYQNGTQKGSVKARLARFEGESGGFALLGPPTNQYDSQSAKPGAYLQRVQMRVSADSTLFNQEVAAFATKYNIGGTAPVAPKGYQSTYTDTVPADA